MIAQLGLMIEHDVLLKALLNAESGLNRDGWNQPPRLYSVFNWRADSVYLQDSLIQIEEDRIGAHLAGIANALDTNPMLAKVMAEDSPGFIGLALSAEGWGVKRGVTAAQVVATRSRVTERTPGRLEFRLVTAVDMWGRISHVQRQRGQKPTADGKLRGSGVPVGLTKLMISLAPFLPGADRPALKERLTQLCESRVRAPEEML